MYRKALYKSADVAIYGKLKEFATQNRKNQTEAETILWDFLKEKRLGVPFRRQHIIGPFIADFICLSKGLVIEVDGGYHQLPEQKTGDKERTKWLEEQGLRVIRFKNEEIIGDTDNVIKSIKEAICK